MTAKPVEITETAVTGLEAAREANGLPQNNERRHGTMALKPDTISLCLELLSTVSVPVTLPDAEAKMSRLVAARQDLLAALSDGTGEQ